MARKALYSPEAWARQLAQKRVYRYGLNQQHFNALMEHQKGKCAICSKDLLELRPKQKHVDHCHKSGVVRGLVCARCNKALGVLHDDPELFARAADYLANPPAYEVLRFA